MVSPSKRFAHGVDAVFQRQVHRLVAVVIKATCEREKPRRNDPVGERVCITSFGKQVAGDLLTQELLIGQIAIECLDHPIAISPSMRQGMIAVITPPCQHTESDRANAFPSAHHSGEMRASGQ